MLSLSHVNLVDLIKGKIYIFVINVLSILQLLFLLDNLSAWPYVSCKQEVSSEQSEHDEQESSGQRQDGQWTGNI